MHRLPGQLRVARTLSMALSTLAMGRASSPRLRADPNIGVPELYTLLGCWMTVRGTRDLMQMLSPLSGITWKQSPRADLLVRYADLLRIVASATRRGTPTMLCWQQLLAISTIPTQAHVSSETQNRHPKSWPCRSRTECGACCQNIETS